MYRFCEGDSIKGKTMWYTTIYISKKQQHKTSISIQTRDICRDRENGMESTEEDQAYNGSEDLHLMSYFQYLPA